VRDGEVCEFAGGERSSRSSDAMKREREREGERESACSCVSFIYIYIATHSFVNALVFSMDCSLPSAPIGKSKTSRTWLMTSLVSSSYFASDFSPIPNNASAWWSLD
jgi:hypothetical protein